MSDFHDPHPPRTTLGEAPTRPARGTEPYGWVGQYIDARYRIVDFLGAGQMAEVFVAEQVSMERRVALKLMRPEIAVIETERLRLMQEIRIAARLSSPHTARVLDWGEAASGQIFFAMELLEGVTLRQHLRDRGRCSASELVWLLGQVCASIGEAHDASILHRDIKPENIHLSRHATSLSPFVRVLDFGLAKWEQGAHPQPLTAHHHVVGTPAYMAPERFVEGRARDHRADLYSIGVIAFELLTGRLPFEHERSSDMAMAHVRDPVPRLAAVAPGIPRSLDHFFSSVLHKDPNERPNSAREMMSLLAASLERAPTSS